MKRIHCGGIEVEAVPVGQPEPAARAAASRRGRALFIRISLLVAAAAVLAAWSFVLREQGGASQVLLSPKTYARAAQFLRGLAGAGEAQPAFLNPAAWLKALRLTYQTLLMSVLAIGIAGLGMLLTVIPAARTAADGSLTLNRTWLGWAVYGLVRALYTFTRAVPELVWAMIIVFIFSPGILPGALALGLHNLGIMGKLCAEVVEDLDLRPVRAVRTAGAGAGQVLVYAVLPAVLPKFLTYLLYRWEVIIRTTIVVGFVGAGGLGRDFRLAMSWFHYSDITVLLVCYVCLVFMVDLLSGALRRMAR